MVIITKQTRIAMDKENKTLAKNIVELRIASRKACMCEKGDNVKSTITLKSKILFLIYKKDSSPSEIMDALRVNKANVALLCKSMTEEKLIKAKPSSQDKRHITYSVTDNGKAVMEEKLDIIEGQFKNILTKDEDYLDAINKISECLNILSYL